MTIEDLYNLADDDGIVVEHQLIGHPALSVEWENGAICIDPSQINSEAEYKDVLAHELGHCETKAFYHHHSPYETKARMERKAKKWEILHLVPLEDLREKVEEHRDIWEIADFFGVPEKLIKEALEFYERRDLCPVQLTRPEGRKH